MCYIIISNLYKEFNEFQNSIANYGLPLGVMVYFKYIIITEG